MPAGSSAARLAMPLAREPPARGQHLHRVEVLEVDRRAHVDRLEAGFFVDRRHLPDQQPRRVERVVGARDGARRDHEFARVRLRRGGQVLQQQIPGFADLGLDDPGGGAPAEARGDAHRAVGDQVHLGAVGGDLGDLADQAFAVDHGVVEAHSRRCCRRRSSPSRTRCWGICRPPWPSRDGIRRLRADRGGRAPAAGAGRFFRPRRPRAACAGRRFRACSLSRWPFALSVSPNHPIVSRTGLSALLAPFWIGETTVRKARCTPCRRPLGDSPKYAVSSSSESTTSSTSTARRLRTVLSCTEETFRSVHPQEYPRGGRPGPPDADLTVAGGCGSCGWSGGSPRTPPASARSRPPRTSAATRRDGPASGSPRAGARRGPGAASRPRRA